MKSSFCYRLVAAAGLALAACGPETSADEPKASALRYLCSETTVDLHDEGAVPLLVFGGRSFRLVRETSASGVKYGGFGTPATWIWTKGDAATAAIDGGVLETCEVGGAPEGPAPEPTPLRAQGNEPGWALTIDDALTLATDYGERTIRIDDWTVAAVADGYEYSSVGGALTAKLTADLCRDDATGMPHPLTASIQLGDETLRGCGGEPAALLVGRWRIAALGEQSFEPSDIATLYFDTAKNRVAGAAFCNSYNAGVALSGESLRIGPAVSTRRACASDLMTRERVMLDALARTDAFDIDGDALVLLADGAPFIRAVR
ncbi:MAG: META domain-containing protein [Pseudomonadota bacterium]